MDEPDFTHPCDGREHRGYHLHSRFTDEENKAQPGPALAQYCTQQGWQSKHTGKGRAHCPFSHSYSPEALAAIWRKQTGGWMEGWRQRQRWADKRQESTEGGTQAGNYKKGWLAIMHLYFNYVFQVGKRENGAVIFWTHESLGNLKQKLLWPSGNMKLYVTVKYSARW